MAKQSPSKLLRRLVRSSIALGLVIILGSVGYWLLGLRGGMKYSLFDCIYMTFITITTVGFGEVINISAIPGARVLTMAVALFGIGTVMYLLSNVTAFIIEGELTERFRRRTMEKKAGRLENHYIVCGVGKVGFHIVQELRSTQRPCVGVDMDRANLQAFAESFEDGIYLDGDATDNDILLAAGVEKALGVFAATDDDNENLVIALTAKQLNPDVLVVARCRDLKNAHKMKAGGANVVVSPSFIGGLRMASEMIRPTVVSFLDVMLRDKEKNLRIEEVPAPLPGKKIGDLDLPKFRDTLLLAVRTASKWTYNPPADHVLDTESKLVVMTTPDTRAALKQHLAQWQQTDN